MLAGAVVVYTRPVLSVPSFLRTRPRLADAVLVGVACLLDLVVYAGFPRQPADVGAKAFVVAYALVGFLALLWRREYPVIVFAVLWVHSMLGHQLSFVEYRQTVGVLIALYAVATMRGTFVSICAAVLTLVPEALTVNDIKSLADPASLTVVLMVNSVFYFTLSYTVFAVASRVGAARRHATELEYERELATREAVYAERGWIARELHDTVAHAVTVIVLQAAGARRIIDNNPARAGEALRTIEDVGKQTMDEMRQLLSILHTGETGDTAPGYQLGLKDLDSLFQRVRAGGVEVRLQVDGDPADLEPGVDLAVYRTVQETLTNATRHSGPGTSVTVQLIWSSDTLVVQVTDDGSGEPAQPAHTLSTGHGLVGLGERIALLGGQLRAGPAPEGGFRVSVTLPMQSGITEQSRVSW